jgi:hypothetical protein
VRGTFSFFLFVFDASFARPFPRAFKRVNAGPRIIAAHPLFFSVFFLVFVFSFFFLFLFSSSASAGIFAGRDRSPLLPPFQPIRRVSDADWLTSGGGAMRVYCAARAIPSGAQ